MKQILLASAAAIVMAGVANAAEPLGEPLPPVTPTVEPFVIPTWAGPYVGADIGWGWADSDRDDDNFDRGFFDDDFIGNNNGIFDDDDNNADGLVGGVFAGWLGQSGAFLYGVELFGQLADIDRGDDDDDGRFGRGLNNIFEANDDFFVDGQGRCRFDENTNFGPGAVVVGCPGVFASGIELQALAGLEGMIGWGGDRAAFLLHAGPALGWFGREDDHRGVVRSGDADFDNLVNSRVFFDDGDDVELGVSVAAEGRFKITERVFAGVIGRAFWFPDVGDDEDNDRRFNGVFNSRFNDDNDTDVTAFEVKARLGVMFGMPAAAAPVAVAY